MRALLLLYLLFSAAAVSAADGPVRIGLLSGFTGVASIPSHHLLQVAKMEIKRINVAGGIKGKKIELVVMDDESNPVRTVELARSEQIDDLTGIIGFPWSQFIIASGDILARRGIPAISILATHDDATRRWNNVFRVCFTNTQQGKLLAQYAYRQVGVRRALMFVNQQNVYSVNLARIIQGEFVRQGGMIFKTIDYIPSHGDAYFLEKISTLNNAQFDSIFLPDDQVYVLPILSVLSRMKLQENPVFGGDGWNSATLASRKANLRDFHFHVIGHWNDKTKDSFGQQFINRFRKYDTSDPQDASALSYDALHVLLNAMRKAQTLSKAHIVQALYQTDYQGLTGRIIFDESGNVRRKPIVIHHVHKGNREITEFNQI